MTSAAPILALNPYRANPLFSYAERAEKENYNARLSTDLTTHARPVIHPVGKEQTLKEKVKPYLNWAVNNKVVSLMITAAAGYSVVHPVHAFKVLTVVPRTIFNLPKIWNGLLNTRPMVFMPYKPALVDTTMKLFRPLSIIKLGNMSLPDWTSRLMTLGLYIPQGYFAIKYQRQPYETWGRNILVWISTFYLIMLSKKPDFPINVFFSQLFQPKQKNPVAEFKKIKDYFNPEKIFSYLVNPFKPDFNYLVEFKKAGINLEKLGVRGDLNKAVYEKKAFWTTLDLNELRQIKSHVERLKMRYRATSEIKLLKEKIKIERFLNNMLVLNIVKYTVMAFITAYLIGVVVPYLVFKYISPLDKKFARPKMRYVVAPAEIEKLKELNTMSPSNPFNKTDKSGEA